MKLRTSDTETAGGEAGVTNLMEYISVTSILLILLVVVMFTVNAVFMEGPANTLRFHAFTDIGNGISVRIVDIYVIAPETGTMTSAFDIPDDVAGGDYYVEVEGAQQYQKIQYQKILVGRGDIQSRIDIAGIGASKGVTGRTTSRGWNVISYDSAGV
jgi:hypothetical protein